MHFMVSIQPDEGSQHPAFGVFPALHKSSPIFGRLGAFFMIQERRQC